MFHNLHHANPAVLTHPLNNKQITLNQVTRKTIPLPTPIAQRLTNNHINQIPKQKEERKRGSLQKTLERRKLSQIQRKSVAKKLKTLIHPPMGQTTMLHLTS
jgi:hypothetical protein